MLIPWATALALLLILLQALPESWRIGLAYDRGAVDQGQVWRLLTGNLVHLGWAHLALNVGVLLVAARLFDGCRAPQAWMPALLVCALAVTVGLHVLSSQIEWTMGLSGVLHGLLLIGACDLWRRGELLGPVLLVICVVKVAWEQWIGGGTPTEQLIGARVVVDAHLWGLLGGAGYWLAEAGWRRRRMNSTAPDQPG